MSQSQSHKCAHPACSCQAAQGSKFCSQTCEDSKNITALACHCGHPGCNEPAVRA